MVNFWLMGTFLFSLVNSKLNAMLYFGLLAWCGVRVISIFLYFSSCFKSFGTLLLCEEKNMIFTITSLCVIFKIINTRRVDKQKHHFSNFECLVSHFLWFWTCKFLRQTTRIRSMLKVHKIFKIMLCTKHYFEWFCFDAWAVLGST